MKVSKLIHDLHEKVENLEKENVELKSNMSDIYDNHKSNMELGVDWEYDNDGNHVAYSKDDLNRQITNLKQKELEKKYSEAISEKDTLSYIFFNEVYDEYMKHKKIYGDTSMIPTPNYFFGMNSGEEIYISIETGKTLIIRYFTQSEPNEKGYRSIYFEIGRAHV